jgi:hypothetical protein
MLFALNEVDRIGRNNGGLGDRLGGMVSAIAFSLRTNRTLLIAGDEAFDGLFRPFHPHNDDNTYTWSNWNWAALKREEAGNVTKNMTFLRHCVNPRPGSARTCTLDSDLPYPTVKIRSNRAYLCRWVTTPAVFRQSGLAELGIDQHTDLFEAAGCMLRLAMWPTERLWDALDTFLVPMMRDTGRLSGAKTSYQVGFHFRCGDSSFVGKKKGANGPLLPKNPQCYFNSSLPWKGTTFVDDKSLESPVDLGSCGKQILDSLPADVKADALAYIASDNPDSSQQINGTVNWPFVILPESACHIGLQANINCTLSTFLQWFMLSLSDNIVVQGLVQPRPIANTDLKSGNVSIFTGEPQFHRVAGAISAFSRYASMYGLNPDAMRYGIGCESINKTALAKQTQGNWFCSL